MSFLIVVLMTMVVVVVAVAGSHDAYEMDRAPRFVEDVVRHSRRSKGLREARGYVEQCRPTNLEKERLGHVNVLAFVDPSWYYSYRQMIMLELLQKRLEKSGFSNILFFVVTPPPNFAEDGAGNDMEIKTWREISKNMLESENFLDAREFLFNNALENEKSITYIQDTQELGIWENFHASKDEVVIVDRCGKFTYQVIIPWSILYFPYVKAAILSTYKDDPCGPCDEYSSTICNSVDDEELLLKNTDTGVTEINNNLNFYTEGTVSDLETAIPLDESERNKDENVRNTISPIEVNTYESTIYDITTASSSTISTEPTENVKVDNDTFATETSIEITSKVVMEPEETQTSTASILEVTENYEEMESRVPPSDQINANNNDTFFTVQNLVVNRETNHEDRSGEPYASLEGTKANEDDKQSDKNVEQQELKLQRYESLPLRIILYAPHLHNENGTLKKYTHLVLKTKNPDYHDHFYSKGTNSNEEPITLKQSDSTVLDDKKLSDYVHSKNESPGVYGEIADYWRTADEEELNIKNEDTEFTDYDYATVEDTGGDVDDTVDSESNILKPNDIDTVESDTDIKSNNDLDEFTQQKLIEHYSKLLKWLYYIL